MLVVVVSSASGAGGDDNSGDYKVRAIFNNASFLIPGEDVKVAGAKVGKVDGARRHRRTCAAAAVL